MSCKLSLLLLNDFVSLEPPKTFVGVVSASNPTAQPYLIRSYEPPRGETSSAPHGYAWKIVEAALATTSSQPSFKPLEIVHQGSIYQFQDPSQSGFSNPTELAVQEQQRLSGGACRAVILSLGAGLLNIIDSNRLLVVREEERWLDQLRKVAIDTQAIHRSASNALEKWAKRSYRPCSGRLLTGSCYFLDLEMHTSAGI